MVGRTNMHFARQPSFSNTFSCFSSLASICMIRSKYEQFGNTSIWPYPCGVLDSFTVPLHSSNGSCARGLSPRGGGGVLPMWWVIHMCRGFDPLFSLWQDRARSFWGIFSHPPTPKRSFGVLKLPILKEFDLLGPKFHFSLNLFGSNFQRPAAHPHQFSDRVPPPPPDCHWNLKNSGNSHWVHELIMQFSCRQSQSIFRLTNYKSVMPSNKVLEAMSHIPLTFLLPPG